MTKQDKMIAGVNIDKGELCYLKDGILYPCVEPEIDKQALQYILQDSPIEMSARQCIKLSQTLIDRKREWLRCPTEMI